MTPENIALKRPVLNGNVTFPVCLAPMVGLTHVALRTVVREYLPAGAKTIWPTEMLNSRKLPHQKLGETPQTCRDGKEEYLVPQILGNEEEEIFQSLKRMEEWGIDGVDINMGCPVKKALRHNYGVALMGDAVYASEVVRMTTRSTDLPVSVKLRAGVQNDMSYLLDFCKGLEEAGASWITLHPRTASQKRRGVADWSQISKVRDALNIAVIGNGDIQTAADAQKMFSETGCDMVMVGRALTARPWMLWQLGEQWGWPPPEGRKGEEAPNTAEAEGAEFGRVQVRFLEELERHFPVEKGLRMFRFFLTNCHQWLDFGHAYSKGLQTADSYEEARTRVRAFFEKPRRLMQKTTLRY